MSSGISLWKRFGSAFRANVNRGDGNEADPAATIEPAEPARENVRDRGNGPLSVSSLLPWVRRNRSLRQLDERYQRVVELMDALRDHFERQDRRAAELAAGVDRLGGTLDQLVGTQRVQSECVASIAARVDDAARHSAGLATMLREMPASIQAQAEAVRAVARQMETSRATDEQLLGSLRQFSRAADSLCHSGTAQVETLQRLHDTGKHQEESLRAFVRSQTRLLVIITIIVAVLGLGAVAALSVVVRTVFGQ